MEPAKLIRTVAQGIQPELAVQGEEFKRLGQRIEPQATADGGVIVGTLLSRQVREVTDHHGALNGFR
jgi:hypothetical protein